MIKSFKYTANKTSLLELVLDHSIAESIGNSSKISDFS